jgi:hypothetical protein
MVKAMPDEKKKDLRHPETFFLPPLKMILSFFDREARQREKRLALSKVEGKQDVENQEEIVGKNVEKLIEKLREKKE